MKERNELMTWKAEEWKVGGKEGRRENKIMQIENSLKKVSDYIKHNNICIVGISEEEKRGQKFYLKK